MFKASIDIGSNSILLLIVKLEGDDLIPQLERSEVTGLGRGIDQTKKFSTESMQLSFDVLREYTDEIKSFQIPLNEVVVTATEASRVAENASDFYAKVLYELELQVRIISGEQEAYYSSKGVLTESQFLGSDQFLIDIGGASTEFIHCLSRPFAVVKSISLPVGVVRLTEYLAKLETQDAQAATFEYLEKACQDFSKDDYRSSQIIGIAGTMTSLACMTLKLNQFSTAKINHFHLLKSHFDQLLSENLNSNASEILSRYPILGKRSETIVAGMLISSFFMQKLNCDRYIVSTKGLRYGTILGIE